MVMAMKRKTVSRIAAQKAASKRVEEEVESEEEEVATTQKIMKKPAATAAKGQKKMEVEEESESEEEESEEEVEAPKKAMKKPAAATAKGQKKMEVEEESEEEDEEEEEEEEMQIVAVEKNVMKKPAAAAAKKEAAAAKAKEESEEEESEEEEEEEEEETAEDAQKLKAAERTKELKSLAVDDLRELLVQSGVKADKLKKEDMVKAMLEQEARVRAVVVARKEQVESMSTAELNKAFASTGAQGARSKEERIALVLKQWQEEGGVEKALADVARNLRYKSLDSMEVTALRALCEHNGVDPFVQEVMAERINNNENAAGHYARPQLEEPRKAVEESKGGDLIDSILANEATRKETRKKEMEQASAIGEKLKELKAMSVEDLKKVMAKKGLETDGKKDTMIRMLFTIQEQEAALAAKKVELNSMDAQELKALCSSKGLELGGKKEMIASFLAREAELRKNLQAFNGKVGEIVAKQKEEFESLTNAELKEMCSEKGLALGGGKDERVVRLVEAFAEAGGEVDAAVANMICENRKKALLGMDKPTLVSLCAATGADPCVKRVMIERILSYEDEVGPVDEPAAKRARKTK